MKDHSDLVSRVPQQLQHISRLTAPPRPASGAYSDRSDVIVLSHLRWDFVFQRPQHLMTRFAKTRRVFFMEEPIFNGGPPALEVKRRENGVHVVAPYLPRRLAENGGADHAQQALLDDLCRDYRINDFVLWFYTPMALPFTRHLAPLAVAYDCMDELSLFKGAHPALLDYERELFGWADVVFTGGQSLYEHKRGRHRNVHAFPSSIDAAHFRQARLPQPAPADQARIAGPRIGYCGVIDERMDLDLIAGLAQARPDWSLVLLGPVVKIDPAGLPRRPNIHYLGGKQYQELPAYLAGWDAAILPFAKNESTRFISPTKTPEYLAAGRPVVSTSIRDVVRPYGQEKLVRIADSVEAFVQALDASLRERGCGAAWLERVDTFLARSSWDRTWERMAGLLSSAVLARQLEVPAAEMAGDLPS